MWNLETGPVLEAIEAGRTPVYVSGIGEAAKAQIAAGLKIKTALPMYVVCPDDTSAETMVRNLSVLLGKPPVFLPSKELLLYPADSADKASDRQKLLSLYEAAGGADCVVATFDAMLQRCIPKEKLLSSAFVIDPDCGLTLEEIKEKLVCLGYAGREQVESVGQFSVRGGILDIFSPGHPEPLRIEFWGDDIDSMGFFDTDTQRRTENAEGFTVLPAGECLPAFAEGGAEGLYNSLQLLLGSLRRSRRSEAALLRERIAEDAEMLKETGTCKSPDRYARLIFGDIVTPISYIPEEALVIFDAPDKCISSAQSRRKLFAEDMTALIEGGSIKAEVDDYYLLADKGAEALGSFALVMEDNFSKGRVFPEPRALVGITSKQLPSYGGSLDTACDDVRHYLQNGFAVSVLTGDERRAKIMLDYFLVRGIEATIVSSPGETCVPGACRIAVGALSGGFEYTKSSFAVLTDAQLLKPQMKTRRKKKGDSARQKINSYSDLSVGDLVVHEVHGIGRFEGVVKMRMDGADKDYIKIAYNGSDVLYVPALSLDMVSKYVGTADPETVRLSKMGGSDWTKTKSRAKAAAKEMAAKLIKLYAERSRLPGHAFAPDSPWQREFEMSFGYSETGDQLQSIEEIKKDMEKPVPMDRVLCGDVGYGKTEVALRAVMKCVLDGYQAAILCPTTVLAQQHFQTASQRFFGYPIKIEVLSRYRTPAQVRRTLEGLKDGSVDIVIGTHRLIQKDIEFKKLGLLVVDEEQRFGVGHKEKLKELSRNVDVLTLSATPIPRTLNMAMSGLKDMSTLEEPPSNRVPVQTFVMEHDEAVINDAIRRELSRGGQVYYLHNRVASIDRTAARLAAVFPDTGIAVAHGKMSEDSLQGAMESIINGECGILVCTTIIETGIDIPNVNTLIIEDADKMGLAQLHQIRGRVGRSNRRAFAYLTYKRDKSLTEIAEKRLSAIREFAEFNSGFRIAMRDLEIRGAGSLLGAEQSGHMTDVGYDMYMRLLEEAVLEEKGIKPEKRAECSADLAVSANIPDSYVPSAEQRMDLYRRIAMVRTEEEADDLFDELIDRFGDPPTPVTALIHVALLRGEAGRAGIGDISQKGGFLYYSLLDFDLARISELYARPEYKGRIKVEAGAKPRISMKLKTIAHIIDQARAFVRDYAGTKHDDMEKDT
ncbi:MAG: transcription-repair coupling factor [Oscillospiraceae bacterium]|nr:transcription-repair coupling factor [Oscillospiraceae bacterium]